MAFKQTPQSEIVPDSPEKILLQLPRRKIPGVLLHQGHAVEPAERIGKDDAYDEAAKATP